MPGGRWSRVRALGLRGRGLAATARAALAQVWTPAALAAAAVCAFEIARLAVVAPGSLGGAAGAAWLALGIAGVLGAPLAVAGAALLALWRSVRAGWRWGIAGEPWPPERTAAAGVYLVLSAVALIAATKEAALGFGGFKREVYRGLAVGLVSAAAAAALLAGAGLGVGALSRGLRAIAARVPPAADPLRSPGRWLWLGALAVAVLLAPTAVFSELDTVDLRPARLVLTWLAGLVVLARLVGVAPRAPRSRRRALAMGALSAALAGGTAWAALALGGSQRGLVALHRDTVLARTALGAAQKLADRDGDGASRWFAGGDCDDRDPRVHPGRYDPPGDGADANCTGADLALADDPLPIARRSGHAGAPDEPPDEPPWNVLLVTIDSLRADAARAHMPRLSALAAQAVDYRRAYSNGAATYWSMPALLASKVPSRVEMGGDQTPVPRELLLPEVLAGAGYHTALFANVTVFFVRGLRQGFHVVDYETSKHTRHGKRPGSVHLTERVLAHIDRWKRRDVKQPRDRFLIWAHYYDPHVPYFEVPGFAAAGNDDRARYDAIVRYTDSAIGQLLDGLVAAGVWDTTAVIVTSDHGDEFLDHGHRFHGRTVYDEVTQVPLVIRVPGVPPRVLDTPIEHRELAPTLLDLLGVPIPSSFTGRSRADEILTGSPADPEPIFLEVLPDRNYSTHQLGLVLGQHKLIYRIDTGTVELYDLARDPREQDNRFDDHPAARELAPLLMRYADHHLYWLGRGKSGARVPPGSPGKRK